MVAGALALGEVVHAITLAVNTIHTQATSSTALRSQQVALIGRQFLDQANGRFPPNPTSFRQPVA